MTSSKFLDSNIYFHIENQDGFQYLTIRIANFNGWYLYGFQYYSEKFKFGGGINITAQNRPFNTDYQAYLAAIKNIEAHFPQGFTLKCAYPKYNELTQLVIT